MTAKEGGGGYSLLLDTDEDNEVVQAMIRGDLQAFKTLALDEFGSPWLNRIRGLANYERLAYSIHFQMKMAVDVMPVPPSTHETLRTEREEYRNRAMWWAEVVAGRQLRTGKVSLPAWVDRLDTLIRERCDPLLAQAWSSSRKEFSHDPSLSPRAKVDGGKTVITVPLLMRSLLKNFNLMFATQIDKEHVEGLSIEALLADGYFGFLFLNAYFLQTDFTPVAIPRAHGYSPWSHQLAASLTSIQMLFVQLHEAAHVVERVGGEEALDKLDNGAFRNGGPKLRILGEGSGVVPMSDFEMRELRMDRIAAIALMNMDVASPSEVAFALRLFFSLLVAAQHSVASRMVEDDHISARDSISELRDIPDYLTYLCSFGRPTEDELWFRALPTTAGKRALVMEGFLSSTWDHKGLEAASDFFAMTFGLFDYWLRSWSKRYLRQFAAIRTYGDKGLRETMG